MEETKIVIVGGGFGGAYTAHALRAYAGRIFSGNNSDKKVSITLISKTNYFLFTPLLHEVATGSLTPTSIIEPFRQIFKNTNIKIIQAEVTSVDTENKKLETSKGEINFDYLVLSTGAETNYYGISGAEEYTLPLKNIEDALRIRERIIDAFETAAIETDEAKRKKLLSFVVVGAGATGIEMVAEIADFVHNTLFSYYKKTNIHKKDISVTLISSDEIILKMFHSNVQRMVYKALVKASVIIKTGMKVVSVSEKGIACTDNSCIESNTIIWASGVKASTQTISTNQNFSLLPSGRILVDEFLRAKNSENIFILGDVSSAETPLPMLAQVAVAQANTVAENILRLIKNKNKSPKKFAYTSKGELISLGKGNAAGIIFGISATGFLMWFLWRTIYLFKFFSWRKRFRIVIEWTINLFYKRDISKIRS